MSTSGKPVQRRRRRKRAPAPPTGGGISTDGLPSQPSLEELYGDLSMEDILEDGQGFQLESGCLPPNKEASKREIVENGIKCYRKEIPADTLNKQKDQDKGQRPRTCTQKNVLSYGKLTGNKRVNENGQVEHLVEWNIGKEYNTEDLCFDEPAGAYFMKTKSKSNDDIGAECHIQTTSSASDDLEQQEENVMNPVS